MYKLGDVLFSKDGYREVVSRRNHEIGKLLVLCQEKSVTGHWRTRIWMIRYVSNRVWKVETFNHRIPACEFYKLQLRRKQDEHTATS